MRALKLLAPVAVVVLIAAAATPDARNDTSEIRRIRAHFDSVLAELAHADVRALAPSARARRAELVATLERYRDRGVFPHNYDFPGAPTPYFVDRKTGTLCAVAHLLASTGRRDIVDRVARADNNVWVAQLATDTAFGAWLTMHGLTLAEAARIQVPYVQWETPAQKARNTAFLTAAPFALGGSLVASIWNARGNADGHRRLGNYIGLGSGAAALGMGAALLTKPDIAPAVGVGTAALGSVSVALATRSILHHRTDVRLAREAERRAAVETSLAPLVPANGSGAGMSVTLRF